MEIRVTPENFHLIWKSIIIRTSDVFSTPPVVINVDKSVISTLGNFSASTGKGKSKKTFNVCAIVAAALTNGTVLNYRASFPEGKRKVLYFDTEQSAYHCQKVLQRINRLCGLPETEDNDQIEFVMLREYSPLDRRTIIEMALAERPDLGLVVIDGLRDLLFDINSSTEAAEVIGLLMRWSSQFNVHIHTVLHLNKGDDNVRGHIGTELNHKAETILQITKSVADGDISEVHASLVRDRDFKPFAFHINEDGLPVLAKDYSFNRSAQIISFDYELMSEDLHRAALDKAFEGIDRMGYQDLLHRLSVGYSSIGFTRSRAIITRLKKFLVKYGMIKQEDRKYVYNREFHYVPLNIDQTSIE